jgi:DNA modification methylase
MPSSVKDRWANKYEHIFFFVKNKKYYFDLNSIRKPHKASSINRINAGFSDRVSFNYRIREACKVPLQAKFGEKYTATELEKENYSDKYGSTPLNKIYSTGARMKRQKYNEKYNQLNDKAFQRKELGVPHDLANCNPLGGNPGDLLDITTKGHSFAHFAVYPEKLIEPLIKSGCPENGIVLDPFIGSGTTALVALKLNRKFIGIELNPEYIKIAEERIKPYREQKQL